MNVENKDSHQTNSIAISKLSQQGYALIKKGGYDEALKVFNQILETDPDNAYALVGIGDVLRKQEKHKEALPYYQKCIEQNPTNSFALFGIADIMRNNNQYEDAIIHWKKYLLYDRNNVAVITRIADSYRRINDIQESERHYKLALKVDPKNCYAFIGLGWLYFGARDFNNALDMWLKVLKCPRDEGDIRIYTAIGNCYYKMREYEKAIAYYQSGEQQDAKNFFALFGLANCYRGVGKYEKAIEYLKRILDFDENNQVVLSRLGDAYMKINDYQQAKAHYKKALSVSNDTFAALGLAKLNYIEGNHDRAITQMIELLQYKQVSTRAHRKLEEYANDPALAAATKDRVTAVL